MATSDTVPPTHTAAASTWRTTSVVNTRLALPGLLDRGREAPGDDGRVRGGGLGGLLGALAAFFARAGAVRLRRVGRFLGPASGPFVRTRSSSVGLEELLALLRKAGVATSSSPSWPRGT